MTETMNVKIKVVFHWYCSYQKKMTATTVKV